MANLDKYGNVGTLRVRTVELRSSSTPGKVAAVEPYTRNVVIEDTVDNVINFFKDKIDKGIYPHLKLGAVIQYLQRGTELRGVNLGLGTSAIQDTEPISAFVRVPGR